VVSVQQILGVLDLRGTADLSDDGYLVLAAKADRELRWLGTGRGTSVERIHFAATSAD